MQQSPDQPHSPRGVQAFEVIKDILDDVDAGAISGAELLDCVNQIRALASRLTALADRLPTQGADK